MMFDVTSCKINEQIQWTSRRYKSSSQIVKEYRASLVTLPRTKKGLNMTFLLYPTFAMFDRNLNVRNVCFFSNFAVSPSWIINDN